MGKLSSGPEGEGEIFILYSLIMQLYYFSDHQRLRAGAVPVT